MPEKLLTRSESFANVGALVAEKTINNRNAMKTETLIELQRNITQGEWKPDAQGYISGGKDGMTSVCETYQCAWARSLHLLHSSDNPVDFIDALFIESKHNATAIALVPELIAEVIRLREALRACADELDELAYGENALGKTGEHVPIPVDALALDSARAALANDK